MRGTGMQDLKCYREAESKKPLCDAQGRTEKNAFLNERDSRAVVKTVINESGNFLTS
jgi:hypothetical protein